MLDAENFFRRTPAFEVEYFQAARLRTETGRELELYADGEYACQTPVDSAVTAGIAVIVQL